MTSIDRASGIIEQKNNGARKISTEFASKVLHFLLVIVHVFSFSLQSFHAHSTSNSSTSQLIARKSHNSAFLLHPNHSLRVRQAIAPGDLDRKDPLHFPASAQQLSFHQLFYRHVYPVQQSSAYCSFKTRYTLACIILLGGVQSQSSI